MIPTRINNMKLNQLRKSDEHQAILIDLALMGALNKSDVEKWIGHSIPDALKPAVELEDAED